MKKYKFYPQKYYVVQYTKNAWRPFLQNQAGILSVYFTESGFISESDYSKDFYDDKYLDEDYDEVTRAYYCFDVEPELVFTDIETAKSCLKEKIDDMFVSRLKHLLKEKEEALNKAESYKENNEKIS